jgi:type I restriction enzyme R subunit
MPKSNLWSAQIEAIGNLEKSLAANKRRALIQMATGSGKTYTAVNFVYRLIKLAGARRVLFLVDRGNLGDQTLKEFQQFVTPDDGRKFTELYNVQHLQSAQLDRVSRVCISTTQRLYSMLRSILFFGLETLMPKGAINPRRQAYRCASGLKRGIASRMERAGR